MREKELLIYAFNSSYIGQHFLFQVSNIIYKLFAQDLLSNDDQKILLVDKEKT